MSKELESEKRASVALKLNYPLMYKDLKNWHMDGERDRKLNLSLSFLERTFRGIIKRKSTFQCYNSIKIKLLSQITTLRIFLLFLKILLQLLLKQQLMRLWCAPTEPVNNVISSEWAHLQEDLRICGPSIAREWTTGHKHSNLTNWTMTKITTVGWWRSAVMLQTRMRCAYSA